MSLALLKGLLGRWLDSNGKLPASNVPITAIAGVTATEVQTALSVLKSQIAAAGGGDVTGPASSVNNNFVSFNLTTGKAIKDSGTSSATFATAAQGAKADLGGTMGQRALTISTSDPSGGSNGDVWFKYTP